jgi:hypothetical protein
VAEAIAAMTEVVRKTYLPPRNLLLDAHSVGEFTMADLVAFRA